METRQNQNPISPSVPQSLDGFPAPDGVQYAGHSKHCECKESAIQWEREYAKVSARNALLSRVVRACENHQCLPNCEICLYLKEFHAS